MSDEKIGPAEFSKMVFNALQDSGNSLVHAETGARFPWESQPYGEDRMSAEDRIRAIYAKLSLKPPKFSWAPSPAALYTAINMLRSIHVGQRHKFIEALVPAEDPLVSAKATLLEAIIDKDITVTMGASLKRMLGWKTGWMGEPLVIRDMARALDGAEFGSPLKVATPARFQEATVYPLQHIECIGPLQQQALLFVPYVHICWVSLPPIETRLYDDYHLCMMRFRDGYEVHCAKVQKIEDDEEYVIEEYVNERMSEGMAKLTGQIKRDIRNYGIPMLPGEHDPEDGA